MAVHKVIRTTPPTQPQPNHKRRNNPQYKAQLLDALQNLNRGYGIALGTLDRLEKPAIFSRESLRNLRNRTEELQALVNHELLRTVAGREEKEAARFGRLRAGKRR